MVQCSFYLSKERNKQCSNEASYVFKDQGIFLCWSHLNQYNSRPDRINFGQPTDYNLKRAVEGGYEVLSLEYGPKSKPRRAEGKAEASRVEGGPSGTSPTKDENVDEYISMFNIENKGVFYEPNLDYLEEIEKLYSVPNWDLERDFLEREQIHYRLKTGLGYDIYSQPEEPEKPKGFKYPPIRFDQGSAPTEEELRRVQLLKRVRDREADEPIREKSKEEIPKFEIPEIDLRESGQIFEQEKTFIQKLSTFSEAQQQLYKYTLSELNSYISNQISLRNFIDYNYIFKQIRSSLGFLFDDYFIKLFIVPVFEKIQTYNTSGYGMADFLTNSIQFKIFEPDKKMPIFTPQNDKTLIGTKNIVFLNKPDGSIYQEYTGQYKNTDFPNIPYVELKYNKNSLGNKFICTQKDKDTGDKLTKSFSDINQAKGFAIRCGFYADTVDKKQPSIIDVRNERQLKVVPIILR